MEILQYTPDMQEPLTQFYNRLTLNVPHCYPVKEEEFAIAMHRITADKADIKDDGLDSETAFVAIADGITQAFIHVGISRAGENRRGKLRCYSVFGLRTRGTARWTSRA